MIWSQQDVSVPDIIRAMRKQEEKYVINDYLPELDPNFKLTGRRDDPVDTICRHKMVQWFYQIVNFCNFKRETVEVAISNLDRFVGTKNGQSVLYDRHEYQLAAMTALYNAVKVQESEAIEPGLMSRLSDGAHSVDDVEAMEVRMLFALKWQISPPTATTFVQYFMKLIPINVLEMPDRDDVLDAAGYQVELATSDYYFVTTPSSSIAFASLLNALESVGQDHLLSKFARVAGKTSDISYTGCGIEAIRYHLYDVLDELAGEPCGDTEDETSDSDSDSDDKEQEDGDDEKNAHNLDETVPIPGPPANNDDKKIVPQYKSPRSIAIKNIDDVP